MRDLSNLTPNQAAAFWRLALLNADDIEKLAMSWLEQGFAAPNLATIAGSSRPTLREIGRDFAADLLTLTKRGQLTNKEAARIVLVYYLEEMISGRTKAFHAAGRIIHDLQHADGVAFFEKTKFAGSELGIERLLGLYYSVDDCDLPYQDAMALIEGELVKEAEKVLARITSASDEGA